MSSKKNQQVHITAEDLYEAIGGVEDTLLEKGSPRRRTRFLRYLPLVAAAVVLIGITGLWVNMRRAGLSGSNLMAPAAEEASDVAYEEAAAEAAPAEAALTEEAKTESGVTQDTGEPKGGLMVGAPAVTSESATESAEDFEEAVEEARGAESGFLQQDRGDEAATPVLESSSMADSHPLEEEALRILVTDGTHTVTFLLNDTETARSLYAQLPLTVAVSDYSDNEKVFKPLEGLAVQDAVGGSGKGGILAYYAPWNNVVMFYDDFTDAAGLYLLGEAETGADAIRFLSGTLTVEAVEDR